MRTERFGIPPNEGQNKPDAQSDFDEEKALFEIMTPEEQQKELALRERLKNDPSKIIEDASVLLGLSGEDAKKLIEERFSIAHDYMVDGIKSLTKFLQNLKSELEGSVNEDEKTKIRKNYLEKLKTANEYLTGLD